MAPSSPRFSEPAAAPHAEIDEVAERAERLMSSGQTAPWLRRVTAASSIALPVRWSCRGDAVRDDREQGCARSTQKEVASWCAGSCRCTAAGRSRRAARRQPSASRSDRRCHFARFGADPELTTSWRCCLRRSSPPLWRCDGDCQRRHQPTDLAQAEPRFPRQTGDTPRPAPTAASLATGDREQAAFASCARSGFRQQQARRRRGQPRNAAESAA